MRRGNALGRTCPSVCNAVTFESLDLDSSSLALKYIFRIFRSSSYIKFVGPGQCHRTGEKNIFVYPVRGWSTFS